MTHPITPTVKQEDHEAAAPFLEEGAAFFAKDVIEAFARHREAAEASACKAALEEAASELEARARGFLDAAKRQGKRVGPLASGFCHAALILRALATPSENNDG